MNSTVAVVTGGLGGLGREICLHLAQAGARVIAADLAAEPGRIEAFKRALGDAAQAITIETVDIADFDSCGALIERVHDSHGAIDILVNNAGITRDSTLRKMRTEQWHEVINVNLSGTFNLCRQVIDGMISRGFGRIVNISSVNGQTGQFGQTNYCAAKAGLHGFTMALAREVAAKGVTVNSVSPGYCRTDLVLTIPEPLRREIEARIPVGRLGEPSDIARVVAFLAAPDAGFITGANIPVNGGLFMDF
jgi:acetoacetyl-CoA reductase